MKYIKTFFLMLVLSFFLIPTTPNTLDTEAVSWIQISGVIRDDLIYERTENVEVRFYYYHDFNWKLATTVYSGSDGSYNIYYNLLEPTFAFRLLYIKNHFYTIDEIIPSSQYIYKDVEMSVSNPYKTTYSGEIMDIMANKIHNALVQIYSPSGYLITSTYSSHIGYYCVNEVQYPPGVNTLTIRVSKTGYVDTIISVNTEHLGHIITNIVLYN